jgi:putative transposase
LDDESRQAVYRALFRSQLDEAALDDIRHALNQGQPLGSNRFSDKLCAAAGVRRTQNRPGRPAGKLKQRDDEKDQTGFGF